MNLKRNRLFTLFLAALMLLTTLAGGLAALAEGSVELTVVTSYGGDDGNRKNYEAAVAAYEEATGNTVLDASSTSNEEWKARVLTDFETGTEPDVLFFFTNADAEPFINAGKVVDIETIRASYPEYGTNMKDSMFAVASRRKELRPALLRLLGEHVCKRPCARGLRHRPFPARTTHGSSSS